MRATAHSLSQGAFSLLELLVVVAMIAVLTVLSANRFSSSARRRELAACGGNLQKIYLALSLYRGDNGAYPFVPQAQKSEEPLSLLVPKCTTDTEIFLCPGSADKPLPETERFAGSRISYDYYMGRATNADPQDILLSDWQVDTSPRQKGSQVFSLDGKKPGNNHEAAGGNLITTGGAVEFTAPKADRDLLFPSTVKLLGP